MIETPGAAYWSVDDSRWPTVRPDLPAHVVDLLALPIVVGVARVPVTSRLTPTPVTPAPATPVVSTPVVPAAPEPVVPSVVEPVVVAAAPAEPAPPPPAPTAPRPVPTPPLNPRPVPAPPPEPRPVPGPPATPRRNAITGPVPNSRRGNAGPAVAGRHRRHNGASGRAG